MGRPPNPPGTPKGVSLWLNADSYRLLLKLAEVEERQLQVLIKRAVADYADRSEPFQRWLRRTPKQRRAA